MSKLMNKFVNNLASQSASPCVGVHFLLLVLAGVVPAHVAAQPPAASSPAGPRPQETVVVTATVAPAPLGNLGRSIDVITRDEIAALPIATPADVLRLVSSVEVRSRGPFGVQTDFSLRGAGYGQALVLVDGVRLNDAQSGHHNGDIPVPLDAIERIEVLRGAGSSLHGADAFGGAINIITRRGAPRPYFDLAGGSFDLVEASAGAGVRQGSDVTHAWQGSLSRSSGFMPAREHRVGALQYQAAVGNRSTLALSHVDKDFGANGFYGPAPSHEWTRQTLARYEQRLLRRDRWQATLQTAYRTHGDRFVYDERQPALSDNRHRTHAVSGQAKLHYTASPATQFSLGADMGGDWIRSNNLGDHEFARGSLFAEWQQHLGDRVVLHPGLRFDTFSRFGSSWNPSIALSAWSSPRLKWRASAGHAFRVPTFTELYYHDPNHEATGTAQPEHAWAADGGLDLLFSRDWSGAVSLFGRWEDDVIDWVRSSPTDRWRTTNIHQLNTHGIETSVRRRFGTRGEASLQYTWQQLEAEGVDLLSKYVRDHATRSLAAAGSAHLRGWTLGPRIEFKRRVDGRGYWVVDARVGRRLGRWEVYVDGMNLLDTTYEEVRGVAMPGRWVRAGLRIR